MDFLNNETGQPLEKEELFRRFKRRIEESDEYLYSRGVRLVSYGEDFLETELTIDPTMRNVYGTLHGGAIFTLADTTGGVASTLVTGLPCVTLNSSISYLSAVKSNLLRARAQVLRHGQRTSVCEVHMTEEDGSLAARATFTYCPIKD